MASLTGEVAITHHTAEVNGVRLHYVMGGNGDAVVLALHNGRMKCIHCASTLISKNGHRRGKQGYICRACGRQFLEIYDTLGYRNSIKEHCLTLYVNGMGFRAIERATGVNHNTVINYLQTSRDFFTQCSRVRRNSRSCPSR